MKAWTGRMKRPYAKQIFPLMLLAVVSMAFGSAVVAAEQGAIQPGPCTPASVDALQVLSEDWAPFRRYVVECIAQQPGEAPAIRIIAVNVDAYYAAVQPADTTARIPRPLLVDRVMKIVGRLGANYPSDGPADTVVRFSDWREGWPWLVTTRIESVSVSRSRALPPLRWNGPAHRYD
jgi:hypothetical protein